MTEYWNEEKEADFQRRKAGHFAQKAEDDRITEWEARMGLRPKCPKCGSGRYVEATKAEECDACGYSQGYW